MTTSLQQWRGVRPTTVNEMKELGTIAMCSSMLGKGDKTEVLAKAVVAIQYGAELGMAPIESLRSVYVVSGKPALAAAAIAALIKRSGKYTYKTLTHTAEACELEFLEKIDAWATCGRSSFTLADAKAAGLGGDVWRKYPRNLLFARALTNGARWYCPDIFMGAVYTPEELGSIEGQTPRLAAALSEVEDADSGVVNPITGEVGDEEGAI